jgi:malonyl-CoA/methylmalonyl-CoA synthetase
MNSIIAAVHQHTQQEPDRPAIFFADQTITYGQLYAEIERFAQALITWGLQPGERVGLFLDNCPTFVTAYLGTHLAAGIVVLVNTQYRQIELSHIINDAEVRLCVTSAAGTQELLRLSLPTLTALVIVGNSENTSLSGAVECIGYSAFVARRVPVVVGGMVDVGGRPCADPGSHAIPTMPAADAPAVLAYTSGTTGKAKGALLTHRNLTANITAVITAWHWTAQDRLLLTLPLFHAHGLMVGMHGTLFTGGSVVLRAKFDASDVLATFKDDPSISLFFGVPTMYTRLLAEAARQGAPTHKLRLFVSGSAPLSAQVFADFERIFGQQILERYGMTETIMNLTNPYEGERRAGTVGSPFPGQEARIVDSRTRRVLPPGEIGEIEVRGPNVFAGYWNRPDATAEVFSADGWFRTGDLGWCSSDGYFTITGRARELIISGGYNIYPREIEDVLMMHPSVAEAAVLGRPDSEMGEQVVAFIVPNTGQIPSAADIIAFCRDNLASYKKPRYIMFIGALPRNALGKVQKHVLEAMYKGVDGGLQP